MATRAANPSPSTAFPSHLACTVRPTSQLGGALLTNVDPPPPTHILAIAFDDQRLGALVPIHGLAWALRVPALAKASTSSPPPHPRGPTESLVLPVIPMRLPSGAIFPLLHRWMYLSSPALLLDSLLSFDVPSAPAAVAPPCTRVTASNRLRDESKRILLGRLFQVHKLRETVVALEIENPELWEAMATAWDRLFTQLEEAP